MLFQRRGIFDGIDVTMDGQSGLEMPVRYYRSQMIISYFEADLDPLKALMPHERLHPIRRSSGKSVIAIIQTYCNHASIPPFTSVAIAVPVTLGKWPAPSYLPLLFEESWLNKGFFIYQEAISSSEAYEAKTELWGYPEFLAEINNEKVDSGTRELEVVEEERILAMRVRIPNYTAYETPKDIKMYSVKQNIVCENLIRTESNQHSSRNPEDSMIIFGPHQLGQQLKSMHIGPHCLETRYFSELKAVCPYPEYLD